MKLKHLQHFFFGLLVTWFFLPTCFAISSAQEGNDDNSRLLQKARAGDALAQFQFGLLLEATGNVAEAATWYRKSAEQGESHAQNALAFLSQKGRGVPPSFQEAVKWYRKSAEQGDPNGQSNLAKMYFDGTGVPQDFTEAAALYRQSAEQGWAWAQAMLAQMYLKGQGVTSDPVSAYMWCELAFKVEDRGGGWGCKEMLETLTGKLKPEQISQAKQHGFKWFEERSKDPKRKHWALGPNDSFTPSSTDEERLTGSIGMAFAQGEVVTADDQEALRWYQLGADRGDALAESHLGERYYLGKGVNKDPARAFSLFKQSAEQGWEWGEHNLATCYLQGIGVSPDIKEAMRWFEKAAGQGNSDSLHNLGAIFAMGQGVEKDYATGYKWLRLAHAAGNNDPALYAVAAQLTKDQLAQANEQVVAWMSAHPKIRSFTTELAYMYWRGEGVTKNAEEAAHKALSAAQEGDPRAQTLLGILYSSGEGVQKDQVLAAKLFRTAGEQGDRIAQSLLANDYQHGRGVEKSEAEAIRWYEKAVAHEDADSTSYNNLAWLYATASDLSLRDPAKALHYARTAVRLDHEQNVAHLDTLAEAFYVNNDYENAVLTEKKALALSPDNASLRDNLEKYEKAQKK